MFIILQDILKRLRYEINNPWVNFFKWGFIGIMGVIFISVGLLISMLYSKKTRRKRKSRP